MRRSNEKVSVQQRTVWQRNVRGSMDWQNILWCEMLSPQIYDRAMYFALPVRYPNRKGEEHVG